MGESKTKKMMVGGDSVTHRLQYGDHTSRSETNKLEYKC